MSSDPYAAPRTEESEVRPRRRAYRRDASRWSRLVAALLDGVVLFAVAMALGAALALVDAIGSTSFLDTVIFSDDENAIVDLVTGAVLYLAMNGYLLALRGQSVGKVICAIQIVDADTGEIPPPARTIRPALVRVRPPDLDPRPRAARVDRPAVHLRARTALPARPPRADARRERRAPRVSRAAPEPRSQPVRQFPIVNCTPSLTSVPTATWA